MPVNRPKVRCSVASELIIGCDLSSKYLAMVAKHPLTPTAAVVKYPLNPRQSDAYSPKAAAEALDCMYEYVESISGMAVPGAPRLAFVEAPVVAGARNLQTTIKQSFVNGVVQAVFVKAGFEVEHVAVSTWKKVVCGNGSADKTQVASSIRRQWPVVHNAAEGDQDIIDAAAVCLYGQAVVNDRNRRG